jgi:hypothetical protein
MASKAKVKIKYPQVRVQLSGRDGNIFFIAGRVVESLRRAGVPDKEVDKFGQELDQCEDYDAALRLVMRWVNTC